MKESDYTKKVVPLLKANGFKYALNNLNFSYKIQRYLRNQRYSKKSIKKYDEKKLKFEKLNQKEQS